MDKPNSINRIINTMGIQVLPAKEGDCIFVQLPYDDKVFRMLIDCGPSSLWKELLMPLFKVMRDENIFLDILVITHIDADHIGGALGLFQDDDLNSIVKEVWYNGLAQIIDNSSQVNGRTSADKSIYQKILSERSIKTEDTREEISVKQGVTLSFLLDKKNIPVNTLASGKALGDFLPQFRPNEAIKIDFISPSKGDLNSLLTKYQCELNKFKMGTKIELSLECQQAFEAALLFVSEQIVTTENISYTNLTLQDIEYWANETPLADMSLTNRASLGFCIQYYGKKFLFLGDTGSDSMIASLIKWKEDNRTELSFDMIKLPHHGSKHNCMKLLEYVDGEYFVISTNGKKHGHPDKVCIAKIIIRPTCKERKIIFNYKNSIYQLFDNDEIRKIYSYQIDCSGIVAI